MASRELELLRHTPHHVPHHQLQPMNSNSLSGNNSSGGNNDGGTGAAILASMAAHPLGWVVGGVAVGVLLYFYFKK